MIELLGDVGLDGINFLEALTPASGAVELVDDLVDGVDGLVILGEGLRVEQEQVGGGILEDIGPDIVKVATLVVAVGGIGGVVDVTQITRTGLAGAEGVPTGEGGGQGAGIELTEGTDDGEAGALEDLLLAGGDAAGVLDLVGLDLDAIGVQERFEALGGGVVRRGDVGMLVDEVGTVDLVGGGLPGG